ncbi:hypothetical protein B0T11DRAFT_354015, partial [Plectosphaerella cucumerina]
LSFVSLIDFDPEENYDENPPSYIRYGLEWTLRLNQKKIAFQTEPDVVLAPSDFWNHTLRSNLENELSKLHQRRACQAETTTVTVSVNARGEEDLSGTDLTRRFDGLGTTWSVVEERLRRWSRLLLEGKKIRIKVVFNYTDTDRSARASGAGRGATASQLAERSVRLDAEQAASGSPDPWRQVYGICRCPGSPCDRGPYCFQDPETKKHYKLLGHHLRQLVKVVQTGGHFQSHGDMPQDIRNALYAEEQQQSNRKRKRGDQESQQTVQQPVIINNYIPTHGNQSSTAPQQLPTHQRPELEALDIPGMRDDAVIEYCAWHCTKVRRQQLREQYRLARDLTLEAGLDLELVYEDRNPAFLTDLGVFEGVARRWVRDVKIFLEQYVAF